MKHNNIQFIFLNFIDFCRTIPYVYFARQKWGDAMPSKKMGRPTDNPRPHKLNVRINDESKRILEEYCSQEAVNRTEAVERSIKKLKDVLKKWRKRRTTQQSHHRFPKTNNRQKAGAA